MAPVKGAGPVHILRESEKFHLFAGAKGSYPVAGSFWLLYSVEDPTKRVLQEYEQPQNKTIFAPKQGLLPPYYQFFAEQEGAAHKSMTYR